MDYTTIRPALLQKMKTNHRVGIFISGGFDSTLLAYLCLKIAQEEHLKPDLKFLTVPRHDDSTVHATRVLNYLNGVFGTNYEIVIVGDPNVHHSSQVSSGFYSAFKHCDFIILGDTKNPDQVSGGPDRIRSNTARIIQPFFDYTKDHIVRLADELRFTDCMTLTHTCTESKTIRCGQCWQCRERAWAFTVSNLIDIGSM